MNGVGVTTGIVPSENWRRGVRAAAPAVVAALACAGALLCVRRALTAVSGDLPWGDSAATAVMTAAVIAAAREAWRRSGGVEDQRSSFPAHVLTWGATLASSLLFLGCCAPTFRTSQLVVWLPLLVAEQFGRRRVGLGGSDERGAMSDERGVLSGKPLSTVVDEDCVDAPDGALVQQLFRVRDEAAVESIYGTLRAEFAAGQRRCVLHVGFCPPLDGKPLIEAEANDCPDATVKVVQALAHGARLEVQLSEPAEEPLSVGVDFSARAT